MMAAGWCLLLEAGCTCKLSCGLVSTSHATYPSRRHHVSHRYPLPQA